MSGAGLRRDIATHTTRIPTQMTITVALTGTIMLRSSQDGRPKPASLLSAFGPPPPPIGGASVSEIETKTVDRVYGTFGDAVLAALEDADDNDGDDDDGESGHNRDHQVEVGQEVHDCRLQGCIDLFFFSESFFISQKINMKNSTS